MRIALVNMPFASLGMPSLALTQLAAVVKQRFGDAVTVETAYLNLEFARYFGDCRRYQHVFVESGFMTGAGDWFFRQSAFPEAEDNSDAYFGRFYFADDEDTRTIRRTLSEKRVGVDAFLDSLIEEHDLATADIVGFTTLFSQTVASLAMARRLKAANPKIITCMGGAACEGAMGQAYAAHIEAVDCVFSGPALLSFPEFVGHVMAGRGCDGLGINGVFPRAPGDDEGSVPLPGDELDINANIKLDYTAFLDAFERAFPDRDIRPVLLFETSRGCYWGEKTACTFCGLNGLQRQYRRMTAENAIEQVESLYRWSPRCPSFIAVDTAMPREYVSTVFPLLDVPEGMKMMYEVRPEFMEDELDVMCAAGIAALQPGIEALSTPTLKLMRKGVTAFGNIRFLKACSRLPVSLDWNLLICSPGEDDSTYGKYLHDIPLLTHLAPPTGVYPVMFVRHSRYFEDPGAYGLDLHPQDFYGLTYPFGEAINASIANYFVDRNADAERMDAWLERLNNKVSYWRIRWLGEDDLPQARLCFLEGDSPCSVYDSRTGEEVEHELSPAAVRILMSLERPGAIEDLARTLCDVPGAELEREMDLLTGNGLVFEEKGRYMSLVVRKT